MYAHVTENDSATASTHAAVLAPSGSATHVPPPAAHASSQLWLTAPSCQEMPVFPHWASARGASGGGSSGGGEGGDGGDGETPAHGQKRRQFQWRVEHEKGAAVGRG